MKTKLYESRTSHGSFNIVAAIILELLVGLVLFLKIGMDAVMYLYTLVPILLLTAFLGTYAYNHDCDMRLYLAVMSLFSIGIGLQIAVDHIYHPLTRFDPIKYAIGLVIAFVFVFFYHYFRRILNKSYTLYLMMIASALIYGFLYFFGIDPNGFGTSAWIKVGRYTVQMTDFTKIAAILFYSALLTSSAKRSETAKLILATIFFLINLAGSIVIHELGSFFILYFLHLAILFIFMKRSGIKFFYLASIVLLSAGAVIVCFILYKAYLPAAEAGTLSTVMRYAWPVIRKVYTRFSITANLSSDPYGSGYQLLQGKKALWMAGLFGNTVNFHAIPVPESDMAFVALVNSFGYIAGVLVVLLFMQVFHSGSSLSLRLLQDDMSDSIVIYGAATLLFIQAAIVILGSCNYIPFTGLPIPFLSRGGTYQTIVFCMCGMMIYLSSEENKGVLYDRYTGQKTEDPAQDQNH